MHRGRIVGAAVLILALGLIVTQLERSGPDTEPAGNLGVNSGSAAGQVALGGAGSGSSVLEAPGGETIYTIDPSGSEVYWRIYKMGLMARLGHNHVISVGDLSGRVAVNGSLAEAEWNLGFSANALIVDDPALRVRYGEDFASVPSEKDKEGTKRNMLTEDVLNGDVYPTIRLHGRGFMGSPAEAELPVTIEMLGRSIERIFPAKIELDGDTLTISGEYRLSHEDLGLKPFSLGGVLSVGKNIDFTYRIKAVAGDR